MTSASENNKNGSGNTSDANKGVQEATAALKGMLGIGGNATTPSTTTASSASPVTPNSTKKSSRQRRNKKKKKDKSPGKQEGENGKNIAPQNTNKNKTPSNKKSSNADTEVSKDSKTKKENGGKFGKNGENDKKNNVNGKKQHNKKQSKSNDNKFAWSAFQSSAPDASRLPMPAFSPEMEAKKVKEGVTKVATTTMPAVPDLASKEPRPDVVANAVVEVSSTTPEEEEAKTDPKSQDSKDTKNVIEEKPVSKTGVNIAALSSSPKESPRMHPNNNTARNGNAATSPMTLLPPQNQIPSQPSPGNMTMGSPPPSHAIPPHQYPPQPHPNMLSPSHPGAGPPPPPGYVTIHVQVPYQQLGPGRQMLVPNPNNGGIPVQVTVPPNVPPGAIIPVHIPTLPLHMMPPPSPAGPPNMVPSPHHHHPGMVYPHPPLHHPAPYPPHPNQHHG